MIPAMHLPAVLAGTRTSPIDGRDLNRSFPGDPTGSFAQVLAHYVDTALLPLCDFQMDLHSGGFSTTLEPCTVVHDLDDKKLMNKSLAAVNAFNAPITLILKEPNAGPTLLAAAERRGIPASSSELGGNARVGIPNLAITERGIRNVLKYHGVLDGKPELDPRYGASRLMTVPGFDNYVFAPANGLWQPAHECGATVKAGQVAGWMHFVEQPSRPAVKLVFKASGLLWCMRTYAKALEGDPLCVVAVDR
jgi:N-alpha-acetyl-L-2,4-diaminobutyrate deacetylase